MFFYYIKIIGGVTVEKDNKVVILKTQDRKYAIDVYNVERILEYTKPKALPETSEHIIGIMSYEESILPVIDLNKRLYKEGYLDTGENKIVVIIWEDHRLGLMVDDVLEIKDIEEDKIHKKAEVNTEIKKEYLKGFIKEDEDIIIYLNPNKIFSSSQKEELKDVIKDS
ncbi:MAG: purine-binding chemotaxis protein CheW [Firmicutes bacterium]|nr:purine-binding chemotaxis protein CheW [Bacillota bacterium]